MEEAAPRTQGPDLEWRRVSRASLHDLFANPIYAGVYAYGVRAVEKRRQKPGRPGTGRRSPRARQAEVFLHDCLPAYISFERYQLNQAQLQSNRAAWVGAPKAGTALLSGLLVCGRCGLRMQAQYNNNGHAARYVCQTMKASYGDPFCQSLKARPLDDLMARLMLEAMTPAAIEASVALAKDLEAERAALDHHWRQRRERASYEVERARRQYAAVEPENRLVARTLERAWEEALSDEAQLAAEYERFKRTQAQMPSAAELKAVRELTHDLPALWRAETTTQAERQTLARLLLERVLVEVIGSTEKVRVECHWHGGSRTTHELTRTRQASIRRSRHARRVEKRSERRPRLGVASRQPKATALPTTKSSRVAVPGRYQVPNIPCIALNSFSGSTTTELLIPVPDDWHKIVP